MSLKVGSPLPSFDGATLWLNGIACREDLVGAPVLVQFWAMSCPICKMNMPRVHEWKRQYASMGVQFISVHMPRMPADTDEEKVRTEAQELGVTEPCAIDNKHAIGDRWACPELSGK